MKTLLRALFAFSIVFGLNMPTMEAKDSNTKKVVGEEVTYSDNGTSLKGYLAYDANIKKPRPVVVVVPEWWGVTDYTKKRARMLAELGYVAIVADYYGDGKIAKDPKTATEYATPFYSDPNLGRGRLLAAIAKARQYQEADQHKVAAIGYCFGGSMVLNAAKMGTDLNGVVCFHGGLKTVPATQGSVKGKILVLQGADDKFVAADDITSFRKNLDDNGVSYQYISYPGATHAFTNPDATANGKKFNLPIAYNANADKLSWAEMTKFLKGLF